ncbi:MAG: hypothetical protein H6Q10_3137 [Acidobacteria bacterium]|nr:hypothetical protein [Acidobacteriota bacterium]
MRRTLFCFILAALVLSALVLPAAPAEAQAHHARPRVGVGVGVGWGHPYPHYPYWGHGAYWGPSWGLGFGWGWGGYWGGPWYGYPYYGYPWWGGYYGPRDNAAEVRLQVTPKDAQVFVDGHYAGLVDDFDGTFQRLPLPPGDHEIVLYLEGYRTVKQAIRVRPRQDAKVRLALHPLAAGEKAEPPPPPAPEERAEEQEPQEYAAPPAPRAAPERPAPGPERVEALGFGALVFRVQPEGAEILIDGERWQGPAFEERLVVQVAAGPHRVEVRKDGYVPFSTEVTVEGGATSPLNVSLPPRQE